MPYVPTVWTSGTTPVDAPEMNNLDGPQYTEAVNSFEQDLFTPFVYSGLLASRHNSFASNVLANTPVRYYRLDEASGATAFDSSGNAQNGTYTGSPTLGATGLLTGDPDAAMTVNGTSQYVAIPTTGLPTGASPFSLEAWVKPTNATNASDGQICAIGDGGSNGRLVGITQPHGGGWGVFAWGGTVVSGGTSAAGVVHHIVGTYDGTSLRLYVDGALVAGPTAPGVTVNVSGTHADIGALWNGTAFANYFAGTVDEVAIYNVALSLAQVQAHYSAGTTATTQVDITSGVAYPQQSDLTLRRRAISSASFTTVTPSTTYYLYAQPDGTTYWSTANTPAANSLALAQVTTDGSGNVSMVSDKRTLTTSLLANGAGLVGLASLSVASLSASKLAAIPNLGGQATVGSFGVPVIVAQVLGQHITGTGNNHIIDYTVPASGLYRCSLFITFGNGTAQNLWAYTLSSDGTFSSTHGYFSWLASTPVVMNGSNSVGANQSIVTNPQTVYAAAGTTLSIAFQDPGGTPNDYVYAIIERLA